MARKDNILSSFLKDAILKEKYNLDETELPTTVREALKSEHPIVKSIGMIVDGLEKSPRATDNNLRTSVLRYLNDNV